MWRYTALPVRAFFLDARALFPLLAFVCYWSVLTFKIALVGVSFFVVIRWFGLTVPAAFRFGRRLIIGRNRPAVPAWMRRRLS